MNKRRLPDTAPCMPSAYLMVRPTPEGFGFNPETPDNHYAHAGDDPDVPTKALAEFDDMVKLLEARDIPLLITEDTPEPRTPDSIFPNNTFSTHPDGTLVLYPMRAENRRAEADKLLPMLTTRFDIRRQIDLRDYACNGQFLEGTGSIVYDHPNRVAFAAYSGRTDRQLFEELCDELDYTAVGFHARDSRGRDIYHTNVMMSLGLGYAAICLEAIDDADRNRVLSAALHTGRHDLVTLTQAQVRSFAGNVLQLYSRSGRPHTVMSQSAFASLTDGERGYISRHGKSLFDADGNPIEKLDQSKEIIASRIPNIQEYGGGGARCMIGEVHLRPLAAEKIPPAANN